jgi:tripartite ATP-independent transporter DctP family solute receptor
LPMALNRRRLITGVAGVGAFGAFPRVAPAQSFKARQYHPQPAASHLHIYLSRLWDAVRIETGGRLDVTVYAQNNGVSIAEPELLKQLQSGELEFFVLNGNILSQAHPAADIQGIPFAFTTSEQVTSLTDGALGALMRGELAGAGVYLIPFGGMENGFKHITAVAKPIRSAADLEGFRMRTPGGKLFVEFYKALGAEPKIVGFNRLYQALAERQVDGQENPLVIAEENKLYEVCRYLSLTNHQWAGFNMLANNAYWQRLPADIQDVVVRNAKIYVAQQRAFVRAANAGLEKTLRERGMIVNTVDVDSFRKRLIGANFYRDWRQSAGEKAWALMEDVVGKVG